jgi:hypothetical protein
MKTTSLKARRKPTATERLPKKGLEVSKYGVLQFAHPFYASCCLPPPRFGRVQDSALQVQCKLNAVASFHVTKA